MENKYQFSETWFDNNIPVWDSLFEQYTKHFTKINSVLEIGCFEGKATVYMCEKWLGANTQYDVVDTFEGTECETGMEGMVSNIKDNNNFLYNRFIHNISGFKDKIDFGIFRGYSQLILPKLYDDQRSYDLIYIDTSHRADDTFVDAYYAHKMLARNGVIIFDDYLWKDPNQADKAVNSPKFGIDTFIEMYKGEYTLVHQGYQLMLQKL